MFACRTLFAFPCHYIRSSVIIQTLGSTFKNIRRLSGCAAIAKAQEDLIRARSCKGLLHKDNAAFRTFCIEQHFMFNFYLTNPE